MNNNPKALRLRKSSTVSLGASEDNSPGITIRAILVGSILCIFLSIIAAYNLTNILGSFLAAEHEAAGALALFFVFVAGVNLVLRVIARIASPVSVSSDSVVRRIPLANNSQTNRKNGPIN